MRANPAKARIESGHSVVNAWISSDSAYAAEVLGHCGFDTVTIDAQHGLLGRAEIVRLLTAISATPAVPLIRPAEPDPAQIGWCLDAGAYGLIVPAVHTPETAATVCAAAAYPPRGTRSFGPGRGLLFGGPDYTTRAHEEIMVWVMIESRQAVENLDAILATPGLYGVYIGPNDLALDLGIAPGGPIGQVVDDITGMIHIRAQERGIRTGIFCADEHEARRFAEKGFDLVTPGNDISMLRSSARHRINIVRADNQAPALAAAGY